MSTGPGSVDPRLQPSAGPSEPLYPPTGAGVHGNGALVPGRDGGNNYPPGNGALPPSPYLSKELPTSAKVTLPPASSVGSSPSARPLEPAYDPRARDPRTGSPSSPAYAEAPRGAPAHPHSHAGAPPSSAPPSAGILTDTIWVRGLPRDVTVEKLANYFGEFGQLKMDRTKDPPAPHINIMPSNSGPGSEARLVWDTPDHAPLAVEYFNGKHWPGGGSIAVSLALPPPAHAPAPQHYNQPNYGPPAGYPPQHELQHMQAPGAPPAYPNAYQQPPPSYGAPPPGYGAPPQQGAPPAYDPRAAYDPYAQYQQAPPQGAPVPMGGPQGSYDPYAYNQQAPPPNYGGYPPQNPQPGYGYGAPPSYDNYHQQGGYGGPPQHQQGGRNNGPPGGPGFHFKGKGGAARVGDWICPACGNNNFSYRTACKQCSIPRPTSAAVVDRDEEGGPPRRPQRDSNSHPDAANDWPCLKCGFRNFSKRTSCYDCHAPKPQGPPSHGPVRYAGGYDRSRPY